MSKWLRTRAQREEFVDKTLGLAVVLSFIGVIIYLIMEWMGPDGWLFILGVIGFMTGFFITLWLIDFVAEAVDRWVKRGDGL